MTTLHQPCFVASTDGLKKRSSRYGPVVDQNMDVIPFSSGDVRVLIQPSHRSEPGASSSSGGRSKGTSSVACAPMMS